MPCRGLADTLSSNEQSLKPKQHSRDDYKIRDFKIEVGSDKLS